MGQLNLSGQMHIFEADKILQSSFCNVNMADELCYGTLARVLQIAWMHFTALLKDAFFNCCSCVLEEAE